MKQARVSFVSERGAITDSVVLKVSDEADFGMVAIERPTAHTKSGGKVFGVPKTPDEPTEDQKAAVLSASRAADFLKESGETLESVCELVRAVDEAHDTYNGEAPDWVCAGARANYVSFLVDEAQRADSDSDDGTDANEDDTDESLPVVKEGSRSRERNQNIRESRRIVDEALAQCPLTLNPQAYRAALLAVEEFVEKGEDNGLCDADVLEFNLVLEAYERARWVK